MDGADSVYNHNAPGAGQSPPAYAYLRPWASSEERLVNQAQEIMMLSNAEIAKIVRCPLPQVMLWRPWPGRPPQPGLMDVLDAARNVNVTSDFSGGPGSYSGSTRNGAGQW